MTITRAFGFTLDTQTGAVELWAAGDPASVAEHLPSRGTTEEHWCGPCAACNGSGWVTRDPDIGADRECSVCDGKP